jgi:hypothetical protein
MTLAIGTKVKRGPHWQYYRQDHCNGKPTFGTVVKKLEEDYPFDIMVKWDGTGSSYYYNHNKDRKDVIAVIHPKVPLSSFF